MTIGSDEFDHGQMQARFDVTHILLCQTGENTLAGLVIAFRASVPSNCMIYQKRFEFYEIRIPITRRTKKRLLWKSI